MTDRAAACPPAAGCAGVAVLLSAVRVDELSFALSFAGAGAIVGQGFGAYRYARDARANTTRIVFSWTLLGFVIGWLVALAGA